MELTHVELWSSIFVVCVATVCADLLFTSRMGSVVRILVFVQLQGYADKAVAVHDSSLAVCFLNTVLYNSLQWCSLRPSVIGQDRSQTKKIGPCLGPGLARCGLGLVVLVLVLIILSCLHHWQFSLYWTIKIFIHFCVLLSVSEVIVTLCSTGFRESPVTAVH